MNWKASFAAATGILLACGTGASAEVIASYYANEDPVNQGWDLTTNDRAAASPGSEGGIDYWEIVDPAPGENTGHRWYDFDLEPEHVTDPRGWRLSSIVRTIDAQSDWQNLMAMRVSTGEQQWRFTLVGGEGTEDTQGVWYDEVDPGRLRLVDMDPTAGFIRYDFVFDPDANGGQGLGTMYIDGLEVGTLTRDEVRPHDGDPFVRWGSGNNGESMHAQWNMVEFAIPEPGTAALMAGSLGLMALRRRRTV